MKNEATKNAARRLHVRAAMRLLPAFLLALALLGTGCAKERSGQLGPEEIDLALEEVRRGEAPAAIQRLERVLESYPEGRHGDRAALVLGKILIDRERHADALEPLARAAQGAVAPSYARLLRVRAILDGGLSEHFAEALAAARSLVEGEERPLISEEAHHLLVKLHSARQEWREAATVGADFQASWPESGFREETRWLTAEALRESGERRRAAELYANLWYDTPGSPWAVEAHERLTAIEAATGTVTRRLVADEQYEFIQALRRFGLHTAALEELDRLFSTFPQHPKTDGALFMKAMSLHDLRKNAECVAAVEQLRQRHRSSKWLPAAGVYAIKALRRNDNTPQIRRWANWIVKSYPGHDKAPEALYNLGVYLGNVVSEEEGLRVLERLIAEGGRHPRVVDALWKVAWIHRRQGHDAQATAALERILNEHPDSGYRKAALYWTARILAERDRGRAVALFQECVKEFPHDYYGHQSMENLIAMGATPRHVGSRQAFPASGLLNDTAKTHASAAVRAAVNLKGIGLYGFAAAELASVEGAEDNLALQFSLAELHSLSGDPWTAIDIANRSFRDFVVSGSRDPALVPREFWYIVYPYNHRAAIQEGIREAGLEGAGIEPYLIAALIRMESRFLPTAISQVGALGLMQMMPGTAEEIARERGLAPPTRSQLFEPSTNIRYGTYYLAKQVRYFQGDWFPAICSYNAGTKPVQSWWEKRPPGQPIDEFVENIPYLATRLYVKRILGDFKNYEWLYRQDS